MQIHLFDCKSSNSLTRGFGQNKLQLCMLVLQELRETYWGADFMYRLFEHARLKLCNTGSEETSKGMTRNSNLATMTSKTISQQMPDLSRHQRVQEEQHQNKLTHPMPEPSLPTNEQPSPLWLDELPDFSTLDQLLSPGFSLSEEDYQYLLTSSDNSCGTYGWGC